jgi:hypothetical protein
MRSTTFRSVKLAGNPLTGHLSGERYVREALARLSGWLFAHGHTHQAALWIRALNVPDPS